MSQLLAIGADGARGGWLAALGYGGDAAHVERVELQLAVTCAELVALRHAGGSAVRTAVDSPVGLLETVDLRPCDKQARALLGARANSVFALPSRPLLAASTYADARDLIAAAKIGAPATKGVSAQAFAIAPKMREADNYLRSESGAADYGIARATRR